MTCVLLLLSYAKAYDPGNWFTVDEETAEIKLNKAPDRESPFLVNGTYIAKILAISKGMYVSKIIQVCYYYFNFLGGGLMTTPFIRHASKDCNGNPSHQSHGLQ